MNWFEFFIWLVLWAPKCVDYIVWALNCLFWDIILFLSASGFSIITKLVPSTRVLMCVPTYQCFHLGKPLLIRQCDPVPCLTQKKGKKKNHYFLIAYNGYQVKTYFYTISRTISLIYIWIKWAGWLKSQRKKLVYKIYLFLDCFGNGHCFTNLNVPGLREVTI